MMSNYSSDEEVFIESTSNIIIFGFLDLPVNDEYLNESGLSQEEISQIPFTDEVPEGTTCSICLDEFSANSLARQLVCGHYFHENCLVPWLEANITCPLCRNALANRENLEESDADIISISSGEEENFDIISIISSDSLYIMDLTGSDIEHEEPTSSEEEDFDETFLEISNESSSGEESDVDEPENIF